MTIDDTDYSINTEFQENAIQLAEAINLDEVESVRLLLDAQDDSEVLGKSMTISAIILYHQRRSWLLECLRLLLATSLDIDLDENIRITVREIVDLILETKDGPARNGSLFLRKCLDAMPEIEKWLQALGEKIQGTLALGETPSPELDEITRFQRDALSRQHESLGAIINHLVRAGYSSVEDFFKLLDRMPKVERWSLGALHYIPIITAFTSEYGSPDGNGSLRDARMLDRKVMEGRSHSPWPLRDLQAAFVTWWLAEYSGWYGEQPTGSPVQGVDFEAEAVSRSESFFQALKDGALQCTLSICSQITPYEWYDPSRAGLIQFLLRDSQLLPRDLGSTTKYFQILIMEQFENFVDAFITNMPDTLRRFKAEEDSQRKIFLGSRQTDGVSSQDLHLERFLLIIAFAFDNRIEAAQSFWSDTEGNLYGFLQWASKRQSTPTVGAFCEMLGSISIGEDCATSAHEFLLEEGSVATAKIRRSTSLSWAQIFSELTIYVSKIRDQFQAPRAANAYSTPSSADDIDEPESPLMLQNYLRLTAHLCTESALVRSWMLSQQDFNVLEILFHLCNGAVPSRLQACALGIVRALLTSRTVELGATVWTVFDQWVSGGYSFQNVSRLNKSSVPSTKAENATFAAIASDFEYMNEFCCLLQQLVQPAQQSSGLDDRLPFPESLGSNYRMPGIEPYVDFVLGKCFASIKVQTEPHLQQRILSWNILSFVCISLATFNEDLVVLGNKSTTSVDEAMNTSSLLTYVRLHPFSRVMEWMFNERVLTSLFACSHQPIEEVAAASPDSPLILSLVRAIESMNLIIDLQSTYLDLVRPAIATTSSNHSRSVLSASLTSFEDSVATHLDLIVDLGLYAGIGNQELTISSLRLLEKLSASKKLNLNPLPDAAQAKTPNRLIGALQQHDDLDRVARSLSLSLEFDIRELEEGSESSAWSIKSIVLDFLIRSLSASPEKPSLAHALLGFSCTGTTVMIQPDGLFAKGMSLFHAVAHLVEGYPDGDDTGVQSWAVRLRQKATDVLNLLWDSQLTVLITLNELRSRDFLTTLFVNQRPIDNVTSWDGRSVKDTDFMFTESADALQQALSFRCSVLQYAAVECRVLAIEGIPSLKMRAISTFLGSTSFSDGDQIKNASVFDLLDFFDLEPSNSLPMPELHYFVHLDFAVAIQETPNMFGVFYDIKLIDELIKLRYNELAKAKRLEDSGDASRAESEASQILRHFLSENSRRQLRFARYQTLVAWADLLCLVINTCDLDHTARLALVLQTFQLIVSKFEYLVSTNEPEALIVARLIQALLCSVEFGSSTLDRSMSDGVANDRFFQVFRTSLRATGSPGLSIQLRESLYNICYRYLAGIRNEAGPIRLRQALQALRHAGDRVIDVICDDAFAAPASCRVSALTLLDSLAMLAVGDGSEYIIEAIMRTNFLQILVESIEDIPTELRATSSRDIPALLSIYEWKFSLLLTVSQNKAGATLLMNAGLFKAVRGSGLFSVDPDIGIEIDNPEALSKYYKLLLAITKIIASVALSRGSQNQQIKFMTRSFLSDNRPLLVAVFKRDAKIGGVSFDDAGLSIEELVELFVLLIAMTDFLEVTNLSLPDACLFN